MQDVLDAYLTQIGASANTRGAYAADLRQLRVFLLSVEITSWQAVTSDHLVAYLLRLREQNYAATSIARKLAAMKSFFHWLRQHVEMAADPTQKLVVPRTEREVPQPISAENIDSLLESIQDETTMKLRDRAMLQLLYSTGMRVTEIVSLNTDQIDLAEALVRDVGQIGARHRQRSLPLDVLSAHVLEEYLVAGRPALIHSDTESALFVNHHGDRLTRQGFWLIVKTYARAAGCADVTPHTLRHSFALNLLAHGTELHTVKELLGHASISTTQMYRGRPNSRKTAVSV